MNYYITVQQAAERLGLTRWRVYQFIHGGRLAAIKLGRDFLIEPGELARFAAIPRKTGQPRKVKRDGD